MWKVAYDTLGYTQAGNPTEVYNGNTIFPKFFIAHLYHNPKQSELVPRNDRKLEKLIMHHKATQAKDPQSEHVFTFQYYEYFKN